MAQIKSATYGNDPDNSALDHVRLLVGDTDCSTAFLTDQEIEFFIEQEGSAEFAAICAAEAIAAKVARKVTQSAAGVSQSLSNLFQHYKELVKDLRAKANANVTVYAGGLSVSEKELDRNDADLIQPYFERGQMRNPDATSKPRTRSDLRGDEC